MHEVIFIMEQLYNIGDDVEARLNHAKALRAKLDIAVEEMILAEVFEGAECKHGWDSSYDEMNRYYRFLHRTFLQSILKLMLESHKQKLQNQIAETHKLMGSVSKVSI